MTLRASFTVQPAFRYRLLWLVAGWMLVLLLICLSLVPGPAAPPATQGDKFMHVFAYAALMSWFANLYPAPARRIGMAAGFIALGIALEFAQRWTGYRTFDIADMAANAAGVVAGWWVAPPRLPNYLRGIEKILVV